MGMGYGAGDAVMRFCEIIEREMRRTSDKLDSTQAPMNKDDYDAVKDLAAAMYYTKKTMLVAEQLDNMYDEPYGASYGNMYGASSGNRSGGGSRGGYGAASGNFSGDWESGDRYGKRSRDSRGRFMDDEMTAAARRIMETTNDPNTREELRRLLEK